MSIEEAFRKKVEELKGQLRDEVEQARRNQWRRPLGHAPRTKRRAPPTTDQRSDKG
jgi:hypothetical protein